MKRRNYTIEEFSKIFNIGRTKIYREIREGRLTARKVGRSTRISVEDADAWHDSLNTLPIFKKNACM